MEDNYMNTPLWDSALPIEKRLDYLIENMTLDEKFQCLGTGCPVIERLGIKFFSMGGEAAHGIEARRDQAFGRGEPELTTCFTQPIGMSSTWDEELIEQMGEAVGNEARVIFKRASYGGLSRWAPTVDMERDPRWGRNEEAYGEDPNLVGGISSAYIKGMRGDHQKYIRCGATLKHFYANNVEMHRGTASSSIDPRNKYEYYLEPFRIAIENGAEGVMTAYNEINGIPCIVSDEVQNILKDTYGLPGHVVSDGGDFQMTVTMHHYFDNHAESIAASLKAGVDCMTDNPDIVVPAAKEAYERGLITVEDMDRSIRNSFRTRIRLGLYDATDENPYADIPDDVINNEKHNKLSLKVAEEAIVLLKNDGILPLSMNKLDEAKPKLAVIGPLADVWHKDWYCGIPPYYVTTYEGIKNEFVDSDVSFATGLPIIRLKANGKYIAISEEGTTCYAEDEDHAELFEFTDWGFGSCTLKALSSGRYLATNGDETQLQLNKNIVFDWFVREAMDFIPQEEVGNYIINSWKKEAISIDGAGKLVTDKDGNHVEITVEVVNDGISDATRLAKESDVAIVVLGTNPVINAKETMDRPDLILPPAQEALINAIHAAQPSTVMVLITNYPHAISDLNGKLPAIIYTASGSQEVGNAIAHTLSGKNNPAGRLSMTWYKDVSDLPDINDYDIIKGRRTYQYFDREVLYPFGYGLSYGKFSYDDLHYELCKDSVDSHHYFKISFKITNDGKHPSGEVAQLYVAQQNSRTTRPIKKLLAWERAKSVMPGADRTIVFKVPLGELEYYDTVTSSMVLEDGTYTFLIGPSSDEILLTHTIQYESTVIGRRDLFAETRADHYDDYENVILHKGNGDYTTVRYKDGKSFESVVTCAMQKDMGKSGFLYYRDAEFKAVPGRLVVSAKASDKGQADGPSGIDKKKDGGDTDKDVGDANKDVGDVGKEDINGYINIYIDDTKILHADIPVGKDFAKHGFEIARDAVENATKPGRGFILGIEINNVRLCTFKFE